MKIGQGLSDGALNVVHLPLCLFITISLSGLFSLAFKLGYMPIVISICIFLSVVLLVAIFTSKFHSMSLIGTRLSLAHISLTCLLGGVAVHPPTEIPIMMLWSISIIATTSIIISTIEIWLTEKVQYSSAFSQQLERQINGVLFFSIALFIYASGKVNEWVIAIGVINHATLFYTLIFPNHYKKPLKSWYPFLRLGMIIIITLALLPIITSQIALGFILISLGLCLAAGATEIRFSLVYNHIHKIRK
ncbi:MAG: hypothetical protein ACJ0HG_06125 [Alphaproteobacteria bacterium]